MSNGPRKRPGGPKVAAVPDPEPTEPTAEEIESARSRRELGLIAQLDSMWPGYEDREDYLRFRHLVVENMSRQESLGRDGVEMDPVSLAGQRIEFALEKLMPVGTDERLAFEIEWQEKIALSFTEIEGQVQRMKFTHNMGPRQSKGGLILPG